MDLVVRNKRLDGVHIMQKFRTTYTARTASAKQSWQSVPVRYVTFFSWTCRYCRSLGGGGAWTARTSERGKVDAEGVRVQPPGIQEYAVNVIISCFKKCNHFI